MLHLRRALLTLALAGGAHAQVASAQPTDAVAPEPPADDPADDPADAAEPPAPAAGLATICAIDPEACPRLDLDTEAKKPLNQRIYAVQQIYAKRKRRLQLLPYWAMSLNDQFVQHPGPGLVAGFFLLEDLALTATLQYYRPFNVDSAFNADVRRAARIAVPLSEYAWGAHLGLEFVPGYGKFAGFGDFIFHWDLFLVAGVGALSTRPIAVIDPDNRVFGFTAKLAGHAGLGTRIFLNRGLAVVLEFRDYVFQDHMEALDTPVGDAFASDPSTWYGARELVNNVQAQLGAAVFLPFSFEYRLPR